MSDHLSYVFWWCAVVLGISSGLALVGGRAVAGWLDRHGRTQRSSWSDWLEHPEGDTVVYCHLTDGSVVAGILLSFNEDYEETEERDLCLLDPWYWPPEDSDERGERYEWYDDIAILAGRSYLRRIDRWRRDGYWVVLMYLSLGSPDDAMRRVAERVRQGGHPVPEDVVRRRFDAGLWNLHEHCIGRVDDWRVLDNSAPVSLLIEEGMNHD